MWRTGTLLTLALLIGGQRALSGGEVEGSDSSQFLKENSLEELHAVYVEYISCLTDGKPETAAKVLIGSSPKEITEKAKDEYRVAATQISARLTKLRVEDVELVGAHKISSKAVVLCYVLNTNQGPFSVRMEAFKYQGHWSTASFSIESDVGKILDHLRGAVRFTQPAAFAVKQGKGRTA